MRSREALTVWDHGMLAPTTEDRATLLVAEAFRLAADPDPAASRRQLAGVAEQDRCAVEIGLRILTDGWHPDVQARANAAAALLASLLDDEELGERPPPNA